MEPHDKAGISFNQASAGKNPLYNMTESFLSIIKNSLG
jgi:hypothetical protein